jgi:hypothetical protein
MAPVIIPAAIAAAAKIGGSVIGGKSQKAAAQIQAGTADKTLAFAREQEAAKKLKYDAAMQAYQAKWEAWQGQRTALLQRYGVDIAPPAQPGATNTPSSPQPIGVASNVSPPGASTPGQTLGQIAMSPGEQAQGSPAMAGAALPKWDDWAGLGLGGQARG